MVKFSHCVCDFHGQSEKFEKQSKVIMFNLHESRNNLFSCTLYYLYLAHENVMQLNFFSLLLLLKKHQKKNYLINLRWEN